MPPPFSSSPRGRRSAFRCRADGNVATVSHGQHVLTPIAAAAWRANTAEQSGLVTLTFDLLTLKVVSESSVAWTTSVPILVFLCLSVLDLGPMYATDRRQTDVRRQTKASLNAPAYLGRGHNKVETVSCTWQLFPAVVHQSCCSCWSLRRLFRFVVVAFDVDVFQQIDAASLTPTLTFTVPAGPLTSNGKRGDSRLRPANLTCSATKHSNTLKLHWCFYSVPLSFSFSLSVYLSSFGGYIIMPRP